MKLTQKRFLKGSREFEIDGDAIYVHIKSLRKEQQLTVDLSTLDPEPVIIGAELAFYSPHRGRPVFSMLLNNPNEEKFNAFVDALKQKITGDDDSMASAEVVSAETAQSALARNVYEEPPEFVESEDAQEKISFQPVNTERLENDITMLKTYLDEEGIKPLLDALETLKAEPENEAAFQKMMDAFNDLGVYQGAVLTYATYVKVLVSKSVRF
jgi:hypothetical protein